MSGVSNESYCCPPCWAGKHKCERSTSIGRCIRCNSRLLRGNNNIQESPAWTPDFPDQRIQEQLCKDGWSELLCSLDARAPNTSILHLDFRCSSPNSTTNQPPSLTVDAVSVDIRGPFTHGNQDLIGQVDRAIWKYFSVKIEAKEAQSQLIYQTALAGGYLHLLGSAVALFPQFRMSVGGMLVDIEPTDYHLDLHLRHLLVFRLGVLVTDIMKSVRLDSSSSTQRMSSSMPYAAAAILQFEVEHARGGRGLKTGAFAENVIDHQPLSKGPILDWLSTIDSELKDLLARDCGRYTAWRSVFEGSTNQLRRRSGEISIVAHLSQTKFSSEHHNEPQIPSPPHPPPHAQELLLPPRRSATRRLSGRVLLMNPVSTNSSTALPSSSSYVTPSASRMNTPSSNTMDLYALSPPNSPANYPIRSQKSPRSPSASLYYTPRTVAEGFWNGFGTNQQSASNELLNLEMPKTPQSHNNPSPPMFIFQGQQGTQTRAFSESQDIMDSFQSQGEAQAGIFTESTFPFINTEDHEVAGKEAYMDPSFIF